MFLLFCTSVLLLIVFSGLGALLFKISGIACESWAERIFGGILTATVLSGIAAFAAPLTIYFEASLVFCGILSFVYLKVYRTVTNFLISNWGFFLLLSVFTIAIGSFYPFIMDHFGYYVPTIKWLSQYGLVKGIANLDLVLGQMSWWHALQAAFSHFSDPFLRLNTVLLLAYGIYIFERKFWAHLLLFPFLYLFAQSPNPDLPVIIFSAAVLNEILANNFRSGYFATFSVVVFAIKPTMLWLPLFVVSYELLILKKTWRSFLPAAVVLLLFVVKNYWATGYPLFPAAFFGIGLPRQPNGELMENSAQMAVLKTYDMQYSFPQIAKFTFLESITNWLFLPGIKGIINGLLIVTVLFLIIAFWKKNATYRLLVGSIVVKCIIVLVFSAQYRFFLDVFVVAALLLFLKISEKKATIVYCVGAACSLLIFLFPKMLQQAVPSFNLGFAMNEYSENQWYKPGVYDFQDYETYRIGNLKFNVVRNYPFSYETPLPAISPAYLREYYNAGIFPQWRGNRVREGFSWRPLQENEKKELAAIIRNHQ